MYLCLEKEALEIFGHKDAKEQNDIININWLCMMHRYGVLMSVT